MERRERARAAVSEPTRARIVAAARELAVGEGFSGFTMEKVAERAGVSRMTVYYQFGSKRELVEALLDDLAARGRMDRLGEAFREADPLDGLVRFIEVFCGFWASSREELRRLRGWAALEPELEAAGRGRDPWRRQGLEALVVRIRERHGVPAGEEVEGVVDVLHALTSFESFDGLAVRGRTERDVAALLARVALRVLGVEDAGGSRRDGPSG